MTGSFAALLIPELRWDRDYGFRHLREPIDDYLELGVGGFLVRGGTREDVAALTGELHRRSRLPLLIAADAPRGAGGEFGGLTGLPPAAALGALRDDDAIRRAARLTARELRTIGVNWAMGPRATVNANPRAATEDVDTFGEGAQKVAEWTVLWSDACQAEGVLATALPLAGIAAKDDAVPYVGLTDAGVATVLATQVPSGLGLWLSDQLKFDGLIVADMPSLVPDRGDEGRAAVEALVHGADLLLAPTDVDAVLDAIERALRSGAYPDAALDQSLRRRDFWAHWGRLGDASGVREVTMDDLLWARQLADNVRYIMHGARTAPALGTVPVCCLGDDGAVVPPDDVARRLPHFVATLRAVGARAAFVDHADTDSNTVTVLFGSPAVAPPLAPQAGAGTVVCVWSADRAMQEAAARWFGGR